MHSAAPFTDDVIVGALRRSWRLTPDEVAYATVGYGSWHWDVVSTELGRLFVTVDAVASDHADLEWAYSVPLALEGLETRIGRPPIPTETGAILAALDETWVVSVWPFLDGRATHDGTYASADDAAAVLDLLRVLHRAPRDLVDGPARHESFHVPGVGRLLELVDTDWTLPHVGPHASAAEELLRSHARDIHRLAAAYEDLVWFAPPVDRWVITHGEPHAANVVFREEGPVLIDWDTAKIAPKERDLWMVAADGFSVGEVDRHMVELYRAQWDLAELADYAKRFADPEDDGPEGAEAWEDFTRYVHRAAQQS